MDSTLYRFGVALVCESASTPTLGRHIINRMAELGRPEGTVKLADRAGTEQFEVERPGQVWAGDITYIRTLEGWLYLADPPRSLFATSGRLLTVH